VATIEQVEATIMAFMGRLERIDPGFRAMMPTRRTIEAYCTDLGLIYHAYWRNGKLSELHDGPADRPDIRVSAHSDDLVLLSSGELNFRDAYTRQRVKIDASMTDLLRLRAVL
jgi:hypothetical protein